MLETVAKLLSARNSQTSRQLDAALVPSKKPKGRGKRKRKRKRKRTLLTPRRNTLAVPSMAYGGGEDSMGSAGPPASPGVVSHSDAMDALERGGAADRGIFAEEGSSSDESDDLSTDSSRSSVVEEGAKEGVANETKEMKKEEKKAEI